MPAARLKSRPNFDTRSHQVVVSKPSRSRIGARCGGIAPRLPLRSCRPVQSNSSNYLASDIGRKPFWLARRRFG